MTYKLSQRSMQNLSGVHPDLVAVVKRAIEITEQEAEDWAGGTAIPAWVSDTIDGAIKAGHIPAEERLPVRVAVRTQ